MLINQEYKGASLCVEISEDNDATRWLEGLPQWPLGSVAPWGPLVFSNGKTMGKPLENGDL